MLLWAGIRHLGCYVDLRFGERCYNRGGLLGCIFPLKAFGFIAGRLDGYECFVFTYG